MERPENYPKQYLYRRVVRAKLFMDDHLDRRLDLDNVSDEACFSKFHFVRLFKEIYGRTPHQYLTDIRIARAKELLSAGEVITRVCYSVGYDSVGSFSSLFQRRVGKTPAAFQRDALARSAAVSAKPFDFVPGCYVDKYGWRE